MRSSAMNARLAVLAVLMTSVIAHAQDDAPPGACLIHRLHMVHACQTPSQVFMAASRTSTAQDESRPLKGTA